MIRIRNNYNLNCEFLQILEARGQWKANNDVAGYVTRFDLLDFLTVRGAGHMVPEYRPIEGYHMISAFVNNEPY